MHDFDEAVEGQDERVAAIRAYGIFDRLSTSKRGNEDEEETDIQDYPESESLRLLCIQVAKAQIGHSYKELYEDWEFAEVYRMYALGLGVG